VVCGENPTVTKLIDYQQFCGIPNAEENEEPFAEISVTELKDILDQDEHPVVIDVREPFEINIAQIDGTVHIPMREMPDHLKDFDTNQEIIVHCKSGGRSAKICKLLIENEFTNVKNVKGGILAWSREVDSNIPQY
jgi:adenylyltransferase/sulfurtransferase